jgi:uncharacterized protein
VKREDQGLASGFLHSDVDIGAIIRARAPSGDFVMPGGGGPLVLASAGVGITPMLSMLHAVATRQPGRPVWFVHGARDGQSHAFRTEVDGLVATHSGLLRRIFYSAPKMTDVQGTDFDARGRITAKELLALQSGATADYMLCGPARFLAETRAGLERAGVPQNRIHVETFGPTG